MKVMTYEQLLAVHRTNVKQNYNRGIAEKVVELLDPSGLNLVKTMVPFHNDLNHHRCLVLLKLTDHEEPVEVLMDIDADQYHQLQTVQHWKEEHGLE